MTASMVIEILLALLLAATLAYCVLLERRLRNLRDHQAGFENTIRDLNTAIAGAQASLRGLRGAADDAEGKLGQKITSARALADELALLTSSGERIASRMEKGRDTKSIPILRSGQSIGEGLRAVR